MGIYESQIVPRVTNVLLGNKEFGKVRAEECEGLSGDVVEIGFGSGLNLPFLPPEVSGVWAVDPSGTALKLAAKRIAATSIPVQSAGLDGAHLDLPDDRFDRALSTMTLCTIPDVTSALDEVRRVLKPGGAYHFAEHGLSPEPKVARFQQRFNPWQMRFAGGCHLNREIADLIREAKFDIEKVRNFYLKGPKGMGYMTLGIARKA